MAWVSTPIRSAIPDTSVASLVTSCSASRLICRSRSARLSAAAAMRFWLISTKVERKMASTEATIARTTTKDPGGNAGDPAEIGHDPEAEEGEVQVDEQHAAGKAGDVHVRNPFLDACLYLFPLDVEAAAPAMLRSSAGLRPRGGGGG